jgi:hypothetical protein
VPIRRRSYAFLDKIEDKNELYGTIRALGRYDLYFLCKYILGNYDMETKTSIHYGLCDFLEDEAHERKLVLMSRKCFKTSIGLGRVVQWIIKNPDEEVGVGSDLEKRAIERTKILKNTFEHCEPLKYFYPDVCYKDPQSESPKWSESQFTVKRSPYKGGLRLDTVTAFGIDPLPTGAHFSKTLMDDCEHEENTNTDELVEKLNARVKAFFPVLKKGAEYVQLGTVYHPDGPNLALAKQLPTYKVPIVDKYGEPTFPSMYDKEWIERERAITDNEWIWQGQYMLKAFPRTDKFFYPFRKQVLKSFSLVKPKSAP